MNRATLLICLSLVGLQFLLVASYLSDYKKIGLYNPDAFSYHLQWARLPHSFNPFAEPVLADPGHDLVRLPFAFPHAILGLTAAILGPMPAYLVWCILGTALAFLSAYLFARAVGFGREGASVAALVHYTWFHILSQLPPLSTAQLRYVWNALQFSPESVLHTGPRQYPHDIFFYPLLYTLLALTLMGANKVREGKAIPVSGLWAWTALCLLLPFNYFYHWLQFAAAVALLGAGGLALRWWTMATLFTRYRSVLVAAVTVVGAWSAVILFQNIQLADPVGYRFALAGGLTEARFVLAPAGLVLRIVLWSALLGWFLRGRTHAVLLIGFLVGCLLLMNMQWITGKNIQPGHWSFGVDRIMGWAFILIAIEGLTRLKTSWLPTLRNVAVVASLVFVAMSTTVSWRNFERMSRWDEDRAGLIGYLKSVPEAVVLAPEIWLETDVLIHTPHRGFLPRGAQSAVSADEHWRRLVHAGVTLGYSYDGFVTWLHTRSVRFFGMLYGTEKEFSSTYFYDPERREGVLQFNAGQLPPWDVQAIADAQAFGLGSLRRPDLIVLHADEPVPSGCREVFSNSRYRVLEPGERQPATWGNDLPIGERKYPLVH